MKARVEAKKADGTAITITTQENGAKETFNKRFAIPLDFDLLKHPMYPYGLKEDLLVRLELVLCVGDTAATYKLQTFL